MNPLFERLTFIAALGAAQPLCAANRRSNASLFAPLRFTPNFRKTSQTLPFFLAQSSGHLKGESLDGPIDVGAASVAFTIRIASGVPHRALGDSSSLIDFNTQNPGPTTATAVYSHCKRAPFVSTGLERRGITKSVCRLTGKKIAAAAFGATRVDSPWWRDLLS